MVFVRACISQYNIFRSANQIDLFIGGLFENGKHGSVGPTFACIIGKQFERLKVGDRYWYESPDEHFKFTRGKYCVIFKRIVMSFLPLVKI